MKEKKKCPYQFWVLWHKRLDHVLTVRRSRSTEGTESQQKHHCGESHGSLGWGWNRRGTDREWNRKRLTLIHFPSRVPNHKKSWCASANLGEEWGFYMLRCPSEGFFWALSIEWPTQLFSFARSVAPEWTWAKCHNSSETFKKELKRPFFSRTKVVSLWVCVDSLWPLFKS